ncbi:sensor histidine kinase [Spirochaeta cellobiosiphila]|uniref:sensor histidine kinase n=1 Tax=Spirochaeta cellobiosiphila TaxID=504483 RepID=UPI0004919DA2|nr:HAMP domain-containing sensor histidine kinase [Spirochaeta cellobiosiphila]
MTIKKRVYIGILLIAFSFLFALIVPFHVVNTLRSNYDSEKKMTSLNQELESFTFDLILASYKPSDWKTSIKPLEDKQEYIRRQLQDFELESQHNSEYTRLLALWDYFLSYSQSCFQIIRDIQKNPLYEDALKSGSIDLKVLDPEGVHGSLYFSFYQLRKKAVQTVEAFRQFRDVFSNISNRYARGFTYTYRTLFTAFVAIFIGLILLSGLYLMDQVALILYWKDIILIDTKRVAEGLNFTPLETGVKEVQDFYDNLINMTQTLSDQNRLLGKQFRELVDSQNRLLTQEKFNSLAQFILRLNHELNSHLSVSKMALDILQPSLNQHDRESFNIAKNSINDSIKVMNKIKTIALELPESNHTLDLKETIKWIVADVMFRYSNPAIEWDFHFPQEEVSLFSHNETMYRILSPFIENVIVHAYDNGSGEGIISVFCEESFIHIKVDDHGKGGNQDELLPLFKPLLERDWSTGLSLGISVANSAINYIFHGELAIYTEPDRGFFVEVIIPKKSFES